MPLQRNRNPEYLVQKRPIAAEVGELSVNLSQLLSFRVCGIILRISVVNFIP